MTVTADWQDICDALSLTATARGGCCWVACSGGLDSTLLLHAVGKMAALAADKFPRVRALHINHQLSPLANQWAAQCEQQANKLSIPCEVVTVEVSQQGVGPEAAARMARYQVFEEKLAEGDSLLLGHHLDDQAETVLFRLFRGHGLSGLAGIPAQRRLGKGIVYRPLLHIPRVRLENVAMAWGLSWVNDTSNADQSFDRNYIRHRILPFIRNRWPSALQRIGKSAQWLREAQVLTAALAEIDLQRVASAANSLNTGAFRALPVLRQKNLLKFWLQGKHIVPGERHLQAILDAVSHVSAKPVQIQLTSATDLYISRDDITCLHLSALLAARQPMVWKGTEQQTLMTGETPLGELQLVTVHEWDGDELLLRRPERNETISVRYRSGGESFRPVGRGGGCSLKKWLQEKGIPVWQRNLLPLVYYDEHLVAIAALAVDKEFAVKRDGLRVIVS